MSNNTPNDMKYLIWIDENVKGKKIQEYINKLKNNPELDNDFHQTYYQFDLSQNFQNFPYTINEYNNIKDSMDFIRTLSFNETIIIVSDNLFTGFVDKFQQNIADITIIPKIIAFGPNCPYKKDTPEFYRSGGHKQTFIQLKSFLDNEQKNDIFYPIQNYYGNPTKKPDEELLLFLEIQKREDLVLPMFYKQLLAKSNYNDNKNFIKTIYDEYKGDKKYFDVLKQIISVKDIPVQLLSKYYIRIYTIEGFFYKNIKIDLLDNNPKKFNKYCPFIQTLYEGLEKKALDICKNPVLYSAQLLSDKQVSIIKNFKNNYINRTDRLQNFPFSVLFSKSFLSFSKDIEIAKKFLSLGKNGKNAILILEKDLNNNIYLHSHADISKLSESRKENEALFFPFSAFAIKEFIEKKGNEPHILKLKYLGKYIDDFKDNKRNINMEQNLPNNNFKNLFLKSGLIDKKTNINDLKIKDFSEKGLYSKSGLNEGKTNNNTIEIKEIENQEKFNSSQISQSKRKCNKYYYFLLLIIPVLGLILYYMITSIKSR